MTEEMKFLKKEFTRIKNMGYIKSTRGGSTGIGYTFESLLGIKENSLELPDYKGIEIKTKRSYSTCFTTLFNANFDNVYRGTLTKLKDTYGYQKYPKSKYKVLYASVLGSSSTFVAGKFLFKLKVDYDKERVYLEICDKNFTIMEENLFWNFNSLKTKLERKLHYLALIKAWPKIIDNVNYYKYYDIDFYCLKSFDVFLKLIEEGIIRVSLKLDIYMMGKHKGKLQNHGISFEIEELNLVRLFDKIEE